MPQCTRTLEAACLSVPAPLKLHASVRERVACPHLTVTTNACSNTFPARALLSPSPEVLLDGRISKAADVYSVGGVGRPGATLRDPP